MRVMLALSSSPCSHNLCAIWLSEVAHVVHGPPEGMWCTRHHVLGTGAAEMRRCAASDTILTQVVFLVLDSDSYTLL